MTDIVHYKIPFNFLGSIAHSVFVRNELKKIFSFRYAKTEHLFGKWPSMQHIDIVISGN
jgi:hypothetical protein